jgi:hypothetical protein
MNSWLWIALGAGVLAFFAFGRGGCGMGHGGHAHRQREEGDQSDQSRETALSPPLAGTGGGSTAEPGHAHDAPTVREEALAAEHAAHGGSSQQGEPRRRRQGC